MTLEGGAKGGIERYDGNHEIPETKPVSDKRTNRWKLELFCVFSFHQKFPKRNFHCSNC